MLSPVATISPSSRRTPSNVDVSLLLQKQMEIAGVLQDAVIDGQDSLGTRDLKDLATASSSLIGLAQRTEHLLKEVETLRLFASVVMEFLSRRSDSLGEDLLAELKNVSDEMHAQEALAKATSLR